MRKQCTQCDKPSVPGLKPKQGLCQYHFDVWVYGLAWANRIHAGLAQRNIGNTKSGANGLPRTT